MSKLTPAVGPCELVVPLALAGPVGNLIFYPPLRVGIGALEGGAHPLIAGVNVAQADQVGDPSHLELFLDAVAGRDDNQLAAGSGERLGGAAHWAKVIVELNGRGYDSLHAVENPLTSLYDDAERPQKMVKQVDGPVLLVGHSYGGAVITQAGDLPNVVGLGLATKRDR